ncbi:head to tail adaptor [Vibrio phage vB_VhaP_PG11]|nr:head to tail adaptor [Vibrio phage vB_VhaP_PG11]
MLTLQDIFNDLEAGELAQFSFSAGLDEVNGIQPEDYPTLISHVNKALTALHVRFPLREREVTVQQYDELSFYLLDSKYSVLSTEPTDLPKYIIDTVERPFTDDILQIQAVYDEAGCKLPLNDDTACNGVWLTHYKTLQIPYPASDNTCFVLYRANHPAIAPDITDPNLVQIDIPEYCIEPLLAYVAGRVYGRSMDQMQQSLSVGLMSKYEHMCTELEKFNVLHNNPNNTNTKLEQRGFV